MTSGTIERTGTRALLGCVGWFVLVALAAVAGSVASIDAAQFYQSLELPGWAPPASVFGPVWTALYIAMAFAACLVWKARGWHGARVALVLFCIQLAANALWSWLFFAWHRGALGFVDIIVLWLLVLATMIAFWRVRLLAGLLLLPYFIWVGFAAVLNFAVWQRNPALLG